MLKEAINSYTAIHYLSLPLVLGAGRVVVKNTVTLRRQYDEDAGIVEYGTQ